MKTASIPVNEVSFYTESMLAKPVIILISGRAGTGKSTTAYFLSNILARKGLKPIRSRFADGLKDCAIQYFGWDSKKDDKGRKLLQSLGNVGREYDEDVWVKHLYNTVFLSSIFPPDLVIIDDWRFPNESEFFTNACDCTILKLKVVAENREMLKGTPFYNDISEISLSDVTDFDFVFDNTQNEAHLYDQIELFVSKFFNKENKN